MAIDPTRLQKLRFRAWRRGFREADLILGPFADSHVWSMTPEELDLFEALLDAPDQPMFAWVMGHAPTPAEFDNSVMDRVKAFRFSAHAAFDTARGNTDG